MDFNVIQPVTASNWPVRAVELIAITGSTGSIDTGIVDVTAYNYLVGFYANSADGTGHTASLTASMVTDGGTSYPFAIHVHSGSNPGDPAADADWINFGWGPGVERGSTAEGSQPTTAPLPGEALIPEIYHLALCGPLPRRVRFQANFGYGTGTFVMVAR